MEVCGKKLNRITHIEKNASHYFLLKAQRQYITLHNMRISLEINAGFHLRPDFRYGYP